MSTTIEQLELEILSSSQSAESGLNSLTNTLGRLKTATKGGLGLTSVVKHLNNLNTSLNGINSNSVNNANGLAKAIQLLSGTKISSSIGNQITAISTALSGANFSGGQAKITELVTALKPLESLGKSSLSSTVNALRKLPDALNKIDTRKLYNQINSLTRIFKPLADEMQKVANGFSAFPSKIQRLISNTNSLATTNNKAATSYINLYAKLKMAATSVKSVALRIASTITEMNDYIENINLFTASMGKYAGAAQTYAEQVGELMGIDPGEWMRNQGVFMTLATGFGIAGDRAEVMSQQMTQLGYDLSSFFNIGFEDSMQKLQSGLSGELEPLRRLGYDLSQAKLAEIALSLGIDKKVASMTQAEKAQLRYYAIMTQVTTAQGDMARTLNAPANQMRIFKAQVTQAARAIGGIFIPALNVILPYAIAVAKVIRYLASAISSLFGFELPEIDYSGIDTVVGGTEAIGDGLDNATKSAKKLKSYMLGFDELNVLDPNKGGSGDDNSSVGGGLDFELPTYDFIGDATKSRVSQIVDDMKEWLGITDDIDTWAELMDTKFGDILKTVGLIGTSIAAWKVATALLTAIDKIKNLKVPNVSAAFSVVGLAGFLGDLDKLKQFVDDIAENGANFSNVTGMLSEFAGLVGDAMITLGNTKTGGALKAVQGVGEIASAISSIVTDGANITNVTDFVRGLSNLGIAIGVMTGNFVVTGVSLTLQGITTIIQELGENWKAIKEGDWSGVDKATLVVGAIEIIGGVATAIIKFKNIKGLDTIKDAKKPMDDVVTVTEEVSTKTSTLTTKLKDLTKNLGLGLVAIAEVATAAALIVGAIWLLGVELDNVGKAWKPVIDNAGTVATAVAVGTGLLVAVGVLTNALGKSGKTMIVDIALGTAILLEIGVATVLFIAEIWAIGKLLDEVGKAWQPVLDNGKTIKTGIKTGTALLVAIGVVTAALGVATTASGYTLPIAIGLGTGILLELGIATGLFIAEIWAIGKGLDKIGKAWKPVLDDGATIKKAIKNGTAILLAIGVVTAALGVATVATAGLLPLAIGLGTALLLELGVAAGLFIIEIAAVGVLLGKVNKAWKPIKNDGGTVEKAIKTGTSLLIAIGVVSAALGVATVATAGLLPLAIGLGTKMLDKLDDAFVTFTDSITEVAKQLSNKLAPKLEKINSKLPTLSTTMKNFNTFMGDFVGDIVDYTKNSILAGIAATVDKFVGFFTTDPIKRLTDEVSDQYDEAVDLIDKLKKAIPKIKDATALLKKYNKAIADLQTEAGGDEKESNVLGVVLKFAVNIANDATTWWSNVKKWWKEKVGYGDSFKTNVKDDSYSWWSNVKSWWSSDSKNGVDVRVNAKKGWSGTVQSALGIASSLTLGFKLPRIGISWGTKTVAGFEIKFPSGFYTYAQGGFPDVGQMFVAREAGPELVGTIGNRNAVVNNDQIVESVSTGVYQAVVAALGSSSDEGGSTQIVVNLDGEKIYENQQKIARNRGYNLGMGAFSFG